MEVVLAHYNEDVSWVAEYRKKYPDAVFTVYTKTNNSEKAPPGAIPLPNVGRESHTYLNHIVMRYDTLAEWTVFSQAEAPTFGYHGHRLGGGHLAGAWSFDDYLTKHLAEDGSLFVFTEAVHMPSLRHISRADYVLDSMTGTHDVCPNDGMWSRWWHTGWFGEFLEKTRRAQRGYLAMDFYRKFVIESSPQMRPVTLVFAQGARFGLGRDRIRLRPVSYYMQLLFHLTHNIDPIASFYLEWMWYDVFHPDKTQEVVPRCRPPDILPHEPALDHHLMLKDVRVRFGPNLAQVLASYEQQMKASKASLRKFPFEACVQCLSVYNECEVAYGDCFAECRIEDKEVEFSLRCNTDSTETPIAMLAH